MVRSYFNLAVVASLIYTIGVVYRPPVSARFLYEEQDFSLFPAHDPYYLRKHPIPFSSDLEGVCDRPPGHGEEGPYGIRGFHKIQVGETGDVPNTRLFCMVYTHSNRHDVLRSIAETYAPKCDGFMAASNWTDPRIGAFNLTHEGPEAYENMWHKVQAMWSYVHEHYLDDFDWFHIGGDDMYVIPDNLKRMTADFPHDDQPWYLGGSIPDHYNTSHRFCGGGAGYTLNRKALQVLISRLERGKCSANEIASDEDVKVAQCLGGDGILCQDTNDADLQVRYHHLDIQYHASWLPQNGALWRWEELLAHHNIQANQTQLDQISNTSVSFHMVQRLVRSIARDRGIRRYHAILHNQCGQTFQEQIAKAAVATGEEWKTLQRNWGHLPKAKVYTGPYAKPDPL